MQSTVEDRNQRPLPLERLHMPEAGPLDKVEPFDATVLMPHNVRAPQETGNYVEAVRVLAACDGGDRLFVKFHRTGNTAWIDTDRLQGTL